MGEMKKTSKLVIVSVIIMIITIVFSITFAYFTASITEGNIFTTQGNAVGKLADITLTSDTSGINLTNTYPMLDEVGLTTDPYIFRVKNNESSSYVDIQIILETESTNTLPNNLISFSFGNDATILTNAQTTNTTSSTYSNAYIVYTDSLLPKQENTYNLRAWINSNGTVDNAQNKTWVSKITVKAILSDKEVPILTLASYIINNVYSENGVNGLYYHDGVGSYTNASEEAGDNSYRYSGANPNNYVCFGSDEDPCPADNLYRIIGLFDDDGDGEYQAKLIKNDSIGEYTWNDKEDIVAVNENSKYNLIMIVDWRPPEANGSNDWSTSDLNTTILNGSYLEGLGTSWSNMIETTTWHLGGYNSVATTKNWYSYERGTLHYGEHPTEYTSKVALMYPSDYGYAASSDNWTATLGQYNQVNATDNNWVFKGVYEWTITPHSSFEDNVWIMYGNGSVNLAGAISGYAARPVFYLKSTVNILSGEGTESNPYRIASE